jgi:WD40 repeat protein
MDIDEVGRTSIVWGGERLLISKDTECWIQRPQARKYGEVSGLLMRFALPSRSQLSTDGTRIASESVSSDELVDVSEITESGKLRLLCTYYSLTSYSPCGLAWSLDGQQIASAFSDGEIQVWQVSTARRSALYQHVQLHKYKYVRIIAWSPDGKLIASAEGGNESDFEETDCTIEVWDVVSGKNVMDYTHHLGAVNAVAWSPDAKQIASGGDDGSIRVWGVRYGRYEYTYWHGSSVTAVAWSPDGSRIASANSSGSLRVWRLLDGELVGRELMNADPVYALTFSPDGTQIAYVDRIGNVFVASASGHV